ncbi:22095_t:CDS:2, partial [Dentiscutata erythropus]
MCIDAYLDMLRQYFDKNIEILLKKDLLLILNFIENHNYMQETVVKTILNKPKLFFSADKFQNIPIQHLKLVISKSNLNLEELQILKKWIDREETTNYRYKFNLLFRKNLRDKKFQARQFHSNCDNKGATIIIGKLKNDSFIRGYNPLDWSINNNYYNVSDSHFHFHECLYKETEDSFIFSSKDKNIILDRVKSLWDAIYYKKNDGPSFGTSELFIQNNQNCWSYDYHHYEGIGLKKGIYELDLFEAFQ